MSARKAVWMSIVLGLCIGLLATTSQANEQPRTLEELVAEANSIVYGQVLEVTSDTVRITAARYLKGAGREEIALDVAAAKDAADLAKGQEVIVFLQEGGLQLVSGQQGLFAVVDNMVQQAEPVSLAYFMWQIDEFLAAQGYVKAETVPEKGLDGPADTGYAFMTLDVESMESQPAPEDQPTKKAAEPEASDVHEEVWHTIMTETFEGSFPGTKWNLLWSMNAGQQGYGYTWDDDTHRARAGSWSGWCADGSYEGRPDLGGPGPYPNNMDGWMIFGPFSLVGATDAELWFHHWTYTELTYDEFGVAASVDGTLFAGQHWSGDRRSIGPGGWEFVNWDLRSVPGLGNLCGRPQVWIAFRFLSDGSVTREGTYVDDIGLYKWIGGAPNNPPTNGTITPSSGGSACGTIQYFDTTWSDADGWADLRGLRFHIGRTSAPKSLAGNAVLLYTPGNNKIKIRNNNNTRWWGGKALGSNNVVENAQARVYCNLCTVTVSGNMVRVRWAVEFKCSFRGSKIMYLKAKDFQGAKTPYQQRGTWTVY